MRRISVRMYTRSLASRLERGSSNSSTPGSAISARARATLCCWPPDSWLVKRFSMPSRPTSFSMSNTRLWISGLGTFLSFKP